MGQRCAEECRIEARGVYEVTVTEISDSAQQVVRFETNEGDVKNHSIQNVDQTARRMAKNISKDPKSVL